MTTHAAVYPAPETDPKSSFVRYEIRDRCVIAAPATESGAVEIWYPVIQDTPYQRVLDLALDAPSTCTLARDGDHGNLVLHLAQDVKSRGEVRLGLQYIVERIQVEHVLHADCVGKIASPALFDRYLRAEQFVDVDDRTRALACDIVSDETNALRQARRLYEYVIGSMAYDAAQQSWKGSTEHALVCSVGNCNDIHALFISLCRSAGIPARLVLGQAFEPPPPGQEACDLCGYHCWAEFFASGVGWVPVDASCACKYGRHHLFGALEMNHIAWSVGRDILLAPSQRGDRLLFFAGPYAELDGRPATRLDRHVTFSQL